MRAVTDSYFRSRKKDGGRSIRSAVGENPMLHARTLHRSLCHRRRVILATKFFYTAQKRIGPDTHASVVCVPDVDLFRSCDLDLNPMTFIYELDPYC